MKKLVFIGIFVSLLLVSWAGATEKKYLNIGGDPVMKDICKKKGLETFLLPEDTFSATVSKSRKVSAGWLREGEEIGWVNKEKTEYVICRCGNSVKFLQAPQEIDKPKVVKEFSEPEPKPVVSVAEKKVEIPVEEEVEIIFIEDCPEVVYVPVERPHSWSFVDYGWSWGYRPYGYGGGMTIEWISIRHDRHRYDRHRYDHHRYDHRHHRD